MSLNQRAELRKTAKNDVKSLKNEDLSIAPFPSSLGLSWLVFFLVFPSPYAVLISLLRRQGRYYGVAGNGERRVLLQ